MQLFDHCPRLRTGSLEHTRELEQLHNSRCGASLMHREPAGFSTAPARDPNTSRTTSSSASPNRASILAAYHRITLLPGKARKHSNAPVESVQITTCLLQLAFETRYAVVVGGERRQVGIVDTLREP
jgi:hypothetical protein